MQLLHTGLAQTLQGQLVGTGTARLMRVGVFTEPEEKCAWEVTFLATLRA